MNIGTAAGRTILFGVDMALQIIVWMVFVWVILSWIVFFTSQSSFRWKHRAVFGILMQLNDFFQRAAQPILWPFRRLLPPHKTAGIDWSPLLLLLSVYMLRYFLRALFGPILY